MISVSKLWGNNKFNQLTNNSKLLYLYLATTPIINYVGVVSLSTEDVTKAVSLSIDELRESSKELLDKNYIYVVKDQEDLYWIIPSHFSTVGNSDSTIEKIKSDVKSMPEKVVAYLEKIGISSSKKRKKFEKPTPKEIEDYGFSLGYLINGQTFYDFYENNPLSNEHFWYDGRGKIMSDWKGKVRKVWCKDNNKFTLSPNTPKGSEGFYITNESGTIFPEDWKDGKPWSKDFLINKKLQTDYEKWKIRRDSENDRINWS